MKKLSLLIALLLIVNLADAQQKKPNILIIWGDDIGISNIPFSAYTIMEEVLNEVKQEQAKKKAAENAAPAPKKKP